MEYERIHKVQTDSGMISPSKLRLKLLGPHRKKDGSNSNSSSRTSPSKLVDSEFGNSLLASKSGDFGGEVAGMSLEVPSMEHSNDTMLDDKSGCKPKEQLARQNSGKTRLQTSKIDVINMNLSAIHPMRMLEDENLDYDSNASSSSFEFDKGERSVQSALTRSHSRHIPSKWNDAEKWIVSRPGLHNNAAGCLDRSLSVKTTTGIGKFSDMKDTSKSSEGDGRGTLAIRSVCMRDMGTEMTPTASLQPSRTATPAGATTPLRSPPSTPRGGAQARTNGVEASKKELSEEEMKLEARREIVALGIQLGKMSIAAWASKDDLEKKRSSVEAKEELQRVENEKRAASWEEAENFRHMTRFKQEEIKIHVWESRRKAKLDAELRKVEAQVEELRARARAKAVKRVAMARQRSEEKRVAAEARESREAERISAGAEYIRETGRFPPTNYICCGWLS